MAENINWTGCCFGDMFDLYFHAQVSKGILEKTQTIWYFGLFNLFFNFFYYYELFVTLDGLQE